MDRPSDSSLERARARGDREQPRASSVRYNARTRRIDVELTNGMAVSVPAAHVEGLAGASTAELREGRVLGHGTALRWDAIDADVYVPVLFRGVLGTKRWMDELGRAGETATSVRKTRAPRANVKKGGRPRKRQAA